MPQKKLALFILSVLVALCIAPPSSFTSRLSSDELSTERIARHVTTLASTEMQGRRAGTPGADRAATYIAGEFKKYGLSAPFRGGYLQPFDFVASVRLGKNNRFRFSKGATSIPLKIGDEFMPLAFSSAAPAAGEAVFVGFGIAAPELEYDNYGSADVSGRVVLVMRGSPDGDNPHGRFAEYTSPGLEIQRKTLKAREKGAAGVVFFSEEQVFSDDSLSRLRHDLNFLDSGIPAAIVSKKAAAEIMAAGGVILEEARSESIASAAPRSLSTVHIEFKTDVEHVTGRTSNVAGILRGSDERLASEYLVVGAHYDHLGLGGSGSLAANPQGQIHHGADDNGSGTAALMEIARFLSRHRHRVKRSVLFLGFSAEELGLLGSAYYTRNPIVPLEATVAMLNMDMVGRLRNDSLFVGGVGTSPAWTPLLEKLNTGIPRAETGDGAPDHETSRFSLRFGQDGFGPSDHQSFYVRDIPVLFFFTGTHDDYHKPSDTADKVENEGVRRIAEFVLEVAVAVANMDERLAFTRVRTESRPTGRGFRVYLGTVPSYSDQGEGLKLDGVRPGSPAEKAGILAGDVITGLAGLPIKNVYDYTYALGELRPGIEVEVTLLREGQKLTLKLTPDRRQ